ncbi:MAG: hypothetical protein ABI212_07030 [Burkholderiaceae bacterium]
MNCETQSANKTRRCTLHAARCTLQDVRLDAFVWQTTFIGRSMRTKGALFADSPVSDVVMSLWKEARGDNGFALVEDCVFAAARARSSRQHDLPPHR